jgi:hypothetical protein
MVKRTQQFDLQVFISHPFSRFVFHIAVNLEIYLSRQRVLQLVQVLSVGHDSPGSIDGIISKLGFEVVIVSNLHFQTIKEIFFRTVTKSCLILLLS